MVYQYVPNRDTLNLDDAAHLLDFLYSVPVHERTGVNILPIIINLFGCSFFDKLSYIMYETVVYYYTVIKRYHITVRGVPICDNCTSGIGFSSLFKDNWKIETLCRRDASNIIYESNSLRAHEYGYHTYEDDLFSTTRYLVKPNKEYDVSSTVSDISAFLNRSLTRLFLPEELISSIEDPIDEIITNCAEHANSPFIYDLDVQNTVHGTSSLLNGKEYKAINVAIWDFSHKKLGDDISSKTKTLESSGDNPQFWEGYGKANEFQKLLEAKRAQESMWTDAYNADSFYALTAFQEGITGRFTNDSLGGSGLAKLVDFLVNYPDRYKCYCLTGNTLVNLDRKYLNRGGDGWYTFNDKPNASFLNMCPSVSCVNKTRFFFPGTAFYLHLEIN